MTQSQFKSLKPGHKVILDFSICPQQTVVIVDLKNGMVTTKTDTDVKYTVNYESLTYVAPEMPKVTEEKQHILKMFKSFIKNGCESCPFKVECDNTYNSTRAHSTDALTICMALTYDKY
ncbi:MAG: hypothetical protein [Wendovervirus sonii]|uniref:Uncharacterized protein n=1 Tax=phage Lak_Megaphage_Sonny TaxID=3109229 RepID=A0ABZ0Z5Z6_9CAUD|nr:MAG: hypothetical protein [phage Lak_Megaphage_Sonny]